MRIILSVLLSLSLTLQAQEKTSPNEIPVKRKGAIKGRVVGDDGQPVEGVQVYVWGLGDSANSQSVTTDEEGNFLAEGLTQIPYQISAQAKGFVLPHLSGGAKNYRIGELANLSLVKGGVITGRVTNAQGDPVVAVRLQITRLRDAEGRKISEASESGYRNFKTDDRGIYRIYGLPAGKYLVGVGGKPLHSWGPPDAHDHDSPTYYPSSTKDTAVEVGVNLGEEVTNINIRYRGEKGYFISGKLAGGGTETTGANNSISVTLLNYPSHSALMNDSVMLMNPSRLFAFYGVADGEYEVVANTNSFGAEPDQAQFFAPPRRVSVKGGNVENVTLQMQMLASVAGKVMVESVVEKTEKLTCKSDRQALPDETVVKIVRDTGGKEEPYDPWSYEHTTAPNDKGTIKFRNLVAGHYYLTTQLPDENWYVKAITLSGQNSAVAPPVKTNTVVTKSLPETDVGKQGLSLSAGEKKQELLLTIASGAASLSGKITAPQNTLLARMRVHLLPAEKEAADDLLRYSEVKTKADGAFVFANLAPGKYWLLLRNVDESEAEEKPAPPAAWDAKLRQQLRREAEAANNLVELKACQRVNDYVVIAEARTQ